MKSKVTSSPASERDSPSSHWTHQPLLVSQVNGEEGLTILMGQDLTYCTPSQICAMDDAQAAPLTSPEDSPSHTLAPLVPVNLSILTSSQTIMISAPAASVAPISEDVFDATLQGSTSVGEGVLQPSSTSGEHEEIETTSESETVRSTKHSRYLAMFGFNEARK